MHISYKWADTNNMKLNGDKIELLRSNVYNEIMDSTVSYFADDTQILLRIKDEEDAEMLQYNSHKLYKWADTNI